MCKVLLTHEVMCRYAFVKLFLSDCLEKPPYWSTLFVINFADNNFFSNNFHYSEEELRHSLSFVTSLLRLLINKNSHTCRKLDVLTFLIKFLLSLTFVFARVSHARHSALPGKIKHSVGTIEISSKGLFFILSVTSV